VIEMTQLAFEKKLARKNHVPELAAITGVAGRRRGIDSPWCSLKKLPIEHSAHAERFGDDRVHRPSERPGPERMRIGHVIGGGLGAFS